MWTPPTCSNEVLNRWYTTPDYTSPDEARFKKSGVISRTRPDHHIDQGRRNVSCPGNQTADPPVVLHDKTDRVDANEWRGLQWNAAEK